MANSKKPSGKGRAWFKPVRGSYLPDSVAGWLTYVPFVGYMVFAGIFGLEETKSWEAAVLFILPNWIAATAVMTVLAEHKS